MQRLTVLALLFAVAALLFAQPSSAQTTVYFTYYTPTTASTYPAVCGTGSLSCSLVTGTTANYTCSSLISGTHYYYPSATAPTFANSFQTAIPSVCHNYTADQTLPITSHGLNLQYGQTCINLYFSGGLVRVNPDARTGVTNFTYSTSQSGVATCPTAVAATSSGSATVGFVYTLRNTTSGVTVCGVGNLQCTAYGSNEYQCPSLINGYQYVYNASTALSTPTIATYTLGGEVECNSYGDGALPLNYEGISFGGTFPSNAPSTSGTAGQGCTSIYTNAAGQVAISYNTIAGNVATNTFTYQGTQIDNPQQACGQYIPGLYTSSSTGTNFVFTSSTGGNNQNGASSSQSSISLLALLFLTALIHAFFSL